MDDILQRWDPELAEQLAEFYRDLHQHPELSFQEHRTAEQVAKALAPLDLEVTKGVGGTGVVAVLRNGDGPVVMLRADMDALPVLEKTGLPYASSERAVDSDGTEVPVMHACGHDMHTTGLVGVLTLLARGRQDWAGTVLAVFQPAEEVAGGAAAMVADGLFERFPAPDVILSQHVAPMPVGMVGYGVGPVMAATDSLQVTLFGRGGHGSMPEYAIDPVLMAASVVVRLQSIVAREVSMNEQAVVTVGRLHAGAKDNIIPDTAELGINIRTYTPEVRQRVRAAVERIVRAEAAAAGAEREPELRWTHGTPVLINDAAATGTVVSALTARVGPERVVQIPPAPASEDVGVYGEALGVPTVYWFWGGVDPRCGPPAFNHTPEFAPVLAPTLTAGVENLTVAALAWLAPA